MLQLSNRNYVETKDLTTSFGWTGHQVVTFTPYFVFESEFDILRTK